MTIIYVFLAIIFCIIQIALVVKIWIMTNDIRTMRKFIVPEKVELSIESKEFNSTKFTIDDVVIHKSKNVEMIIKSIDFKNNTYACYVSDGLVLDGNYKEEELIKKF